MTLRYGQARPEHLPGSGLNSQNMHRNAKKGFCFALKLHALRTHQGHVAPESDRRV